MWSKALQELKICKLILRVEFFFSLLEGLFDVVTMAKVTTPEVAEALTRGSYFNAFGGNPVCTATGHAVLKDKLQHNAHVDKYGTIGDARGWGFMLGVEFVTDSQLRKAETLDVMDKMKQMGVLIGKGGFYGNVFRIAPPLCFTKEDANYLVDVMDCSMTKK
ncbi:Alanine--glyoxylate aminotransferase 2 [Citrus sinensis]|uniref:Alanine--glyoxylate aminotransferase 2 n=1 Tax=Citrus sinensis TaxID=2711 RepID=A0ACB8MLR3_CITSI|nr:Alanine--glyoxylate aminotransferase 2 [Citrus sinensis]